MQEIRGTLGARVRPKSLTHATRGVEFVSGGILTFALEMHSVMGEWAKSASIGGVIADAVNGGEVRLGLVRLL